MKPILHILTTIICSVLLSCTGSGDRRQEVAVDSPRIKKTTQLIKPKKNEKVTWGEAISVEIKGENQIDSVVIIHQQDRQIFQGGSFQWSPQTFKTGKQRLKTSVYSGGVEETHYATFILLPDQAPEKYTYTVINTFPHSTKAYTQGLFFKGDTLIESTGQKGESRIQKLNLNTGNPYAVTALEDRYFGEGSTIWQDRIYMLTWTSQIGFIFNTQLQQEGTFRYSHEGWGLTTWNDVLIASDGTEVLHLMDPRDLSEVSRLEVYDHQGPVTNINELEMINDLLYANIYMEDIIVVIDPNSGQVLRTIDMSGLLNARESARSDVLNGIAYLPEQDKIYITGKNWPKLFEVTFHRQPL